MVGQSSSQVPDDKRRVVGALDELSDFVRRQNVLRKRKREIGVEVRSRGKETIQSGAVVIRAPDVGPDGIQPGEQSPQRHSPAKALFIRKVGELQHLVVAGLQGITTPPASLLHAA